MFFVIVQIHFFVILQLRLQLFLIYCDVSVSHHKQFLQGVFGNAIIFISG